MQPNYEEFRAKQKRAEEQISSGMTHTTLETHRLEQARAEDQLYEAKLISRLFARAKQAIQGALGRGTKPPAQPS